MIEQQRMLSNVLSSLIDTRKIAAGKERFQSALMEHEHLLQSMNVKTSERVHLFFLSVDPRMHHLLDLT